MSHEIQLTQKQSDFFRLSDTFRLFVAGYGAGKSMTLIVGVISDLFNYPGSNVAVYSPTYDLNALNLAPRFEDVLRQMGVKSDHNKQRGTITVSGYGQIIYRSMSVPERIIAYEVFRSHIDELDTLPTNKAEAIWNKIIARNRQSIFDSDGKQAQNRVSAYTTPEGFKFCYKRWVKNQTEGYSYIKAPTYSNPHNPPEYIQNLRNTYPPELVEAYIEGNFVNLTSGSVYYTFDRELHKTKYTVRPKETVHIGMDFNVMHMAAIVFTHRKERFYAVDELVEIRDTPDMIDIILEKYAKAGHPVIIYPDATGKQKSSKGATLSDISLLKRAKFIIRARRQNPFIRDRVACVNKLIVDERLFINVEKCPILTEALEQQVYDMNGSPDKTSGLDHPLDATGYHCYYQQPIINSSIVQRQVRGL